MSIPTKITTELTALQAQIAAATPLTNASFATIKAMQLNSAQLVNDVQNLLIATNRLDTWTASVDPKTIISGFNLSVTAANDQQNLSLLRGVAGRVASNLSQLV